MPALRALVYDPKVSVKVRRLAIEQLASCGEIARPEAPKLRRLLTEKNPDLSDALVGALGELQDQDSVELIASRYAELLKQPNDADFPDGDENYWSKYWALTALRRIGGEAAVRTIALALRDPNPMVKGDACGCLAQHSKLATKYVPELVRLLDDPAIYEGQSLFDHHPICAEAADALAKIGVPDQAAIDKLTALMHRPLEVKKNQLGGDVSLRIRASAAAALAQLDPKGDEQVRCLQELAQHESDRWALKSLLDLQPPPKDIALFCSRFAARLEPERLMDAIRRAQHKNPELLPLLCEHRAYDAIGSYGTAAAELRPFLLEASETLTEKERERAVLALIAVSTLPEDLLKLRPYLAEDPTMEHLLALRGRGLSLQPLEPELTAIAAKNSRAYFRQAARQLLDEIHQNKP